MHERALTTPHVSPLLVKTKPKPILFCFSHLRWDFVWQRPQHLMTRAAGNYDVCVIEEPLFRDHVSPHWEMNQVSEGVTVAVPILPHGLAPEDVTAEQHELVEQLLDREPNRPRVFWYYTPMAMSFTSDFESDLCVYDNMDELSLFSGASPELMALEKALFLRSDLVFTGGMSLYEAKKKRHHNVHAFPSSIEAEHFAKARRASVDPSDQADIPHPRIGFFGVIDERMDVALLGEIAALRPDWHFVMIGPVVKIDPAILPRSANIHWLGGKTYRELPSYLGHWDVGLMPFALNDATRFISPTKTPEFLAAGVPVVSTAIADVVRPYGEKGLVEIAHSAHETIAKIEGIFDRPKDAWLVKVDRHLATGSWDKTWMAMQRLMLDGMGDGDALNTPLARSSPITTPAE